MRITLGRASRHGIVLGHQRALLLRLVVLVRARLPPVISSLGCMRALAGAVRRHFHPLGCGAAGVELVHRLERLADAEEEEHELLLGEAGVVDEVGVDHVLQVATAVVREEDVDRLAARVAALAGDAVVDAVDDGFAALEELVGLDLLHGLRDGLGPERAADLLERIELRRGGIGYEVYIGEATLYET